MADLIRDWAWFACLLCVPVLVLSIFGPDIKTAWVNRLERRAAAAKAKATKAGGEK